MKEINPIQESDNYIEPQELKNRLYSLIWEYKRIDDLIKKRIIDRQKEFKRDMKLFIIFFIFAMASVLASLIMELKI